MRLSPAGAAVSLAILLLAVAAPAAQAHAAYESSDPADGATVASPPSRVTADFTEPLVDGSRLEVYDPCGERVDNGDSLVAGDRLTVTMSADKQGAYSVRFSVVSAVDGHPTNGDFGFTSSGGAPCGGEPEQEQEQPNEEPAGGGAGSGSGGGGGSGGSSESAASSSSTAGGGSSKEGASNERGASNSRGRNQPAGRDQRGSEPPARRLAAPKARVANIQPASAPGGAKQPRVWDGIPTGTFAVGLLLSAVIGAAGGKIYAGIMGWTSPPKKRSLRR